MATRKKRVPVPADVSDTVLVASDHTCCICRNPERRVQIHHIDEDPSNNEPSNLAVLCLICHDEQQRQGGIGRSYTAGAVRQYRDEWLRLVHEKKSGQSPHAAPAPSQKSERLRSLYEGLLHGACSLRDYCEQLDNGIFGNAPLDFRQEQLRPVLVKAHQLIESTLPKVRIEPGSQDVCEAYDAFRRAVTSYYSGFASKLQGDSAYSAALMMFAQLNMNRYLREMQEAIHAHLVEMDPRA